MENRYQIAREACGLTEEDVCMRLGISSMLLRDIENGRIQPDALLVGRMALLYHTTSDWLIGLRSY